jgi:hypothetical protein
MYDQINLINALVNKNENRQRQELYLHKILDAAKF